MSVIAQCPECEAPTRETNETEGNGWYWACMNGHVGYATADQPASMFDAYATHIVTRKLDGQIDIQVAAFGIQQAGDIISDYRAMDLEHHGTDDNDHITYSVVPIGHEDY